MIIRFCYNNSSILKVDQQHSKRNIVEQQIRWQFILKEAPWMISRFLASSIVIKFVFDGLITNAVFYNPAIHGT